MKIYTVINKIKFSSEQTILFGLLDKLPNEPSYSKNFDGISRYHGLIEFLKEHVEYVSNPHDCDIIVLPYKFINTEDKLYNLLLNIAVQLNKELWCFYNDDSDTVYELHKNVRLFRTSFYNSTRLQNEYPLSTVSPDYFNNVYKNDNVLSIGYCGHMNHGREKYINILNQSDIKTDFIIRTGFWAPGVNKDTARYEYIKNIEDNVFTFCYRGAGNFSYRFYETMMMGRIPIFINTDCVLPFWDVLSRENIGLFIDEVDILSGKINLIDEIKNYYNENIDGIIDIQKNNRRIYEEYLSPIAFLYNLI